MSHYDVCCRTFAGDTVPSTVNEKPELSMSTSSKKQESTLTYSLKPDSGGMHKFHLAQHDWNALSFVVHSTSCHVKQHVERVRSQSLSLLNSLVPRLHVLAFCIYGIYSPVHEILN